MQTSYGFDILYEEGPCLVVAKPGGVLTQAPPSIDSLEVRIKRFLKFRDSKRYRDRLGQAQKKTGEKDALVSVTGTLHGRPVVACAFEFSFMGGSMGSAVGEKVTRAAEEALARQCPLIVVSASGGARMQEGILSLMQMAKISAALARLAEARLPYISVLTDPTTGGVTASFAMLGDLNIAEPGALIGFAGPIWMVPYTNAFAETGLTLASKT